MKLFLKIIAGLFLFSILSFSLFAGGAFFLNRPVNQSTGSAYYLTISKGESTGKIAWKLKRDGIIRNPYIFILIAKYQGTESKLRTGKFLLQKDWSTYKIHQKIFFGTQELIKVTLPEGITLKRVGRILEENSIVGYLEFLDASRNKDLLYEFGIAGETVEGFLFPDTYLFAPEQPASEVLRYLIQHFYDNLRTAYPDYIHMSNKDLYEKVILASIIEREYRSVQEAPLIASVFENRLDKGIALGSCATVEYIITEIEGKPHPERIFYRDTEKNNPYNTYIYRGLPPGPISNPGLVALTAAFKPAKTDYYYFVLKNPDEGKHYFSSSLSEHNQAKQLYLKKR